jgi:hypothetical protein
MLDHCRPPPRGPGGDPGGEAGCREFVPAPPDPAALAEDLRGRAALWHGLHRGGPAGAAPGENPDAAAEVSWNYLVVCMTRAERNAELPTTVPDMRHHKGVKRLAARLAARLVLFFTRFLFRQQREYNLVVLEALRTYPAFIRKVSQAHEQRLRGLRRLLAAQGVRIHGLERQLADLRVAAGDARPRGPRAAA